MQIANMIYRGDYVVAWLLSLINIGLIQQTSTAIAFVYVEYLNSIRTYNVARLSGLRIGVVKNNYLLLF